MPNREGKCSCCAQIDYFFSILTKFELPDREIEAGDAGECFLICRVIFSWCLLTRIKAMEAAAAERLKKTEDEQREKGKQRLADESKSKRLAEEQDQENQRLAEEQERARIAKASSDVARRLNLFFIIVANDS